MDSCTPVFLRREESLPGGLLGFSGTDGVAISRTRVPSLLVMETCAQASSQAGKTGFLEEGRHGGGKSGLCPSVPTTDAATLQDLKKTENVYIRERLRPHLKCKVGTAGQDLI